jgi:alpha-L-rhamnosidase
VTSRAELEQLGDLVRTVPLSFVSPTNVFANCVWVHSREALPVPTSLQMLAAPNGTPVEVPRFDGGDTEFVVDFGRILSGYLEFEVEAPEGAVLDFYGFEFIHEGLRQDTYRVDNTLRFVCRAGRQHFSSAVRRGLRYLMVTVRGTPGPVRFHQLVFHQSNYPAPEVGSFHCSDALVDDIWEISRHTTRVCMEDTFVDCPTYEQAFWVGDSRNESLVAYYAFGAELLVRRCLRLVPGSRGQTPFYGSQVPSGWINVIPDWTFLWVIACREHYDRTGDLAFAREIWPHLRFTLDAYLQQRDEDGLLSISAWNLLDWAPMDQPNDGVVTHQNCFMVAALRAAAELAELANEDGAKAYQTAASQLATAIDRHLWSDERGAYIDAIPPRTAGARRSSACRRRLLPTSAASPRANAPSERCSTCSSRCPISCRSAALLCRSSTTRRWRSSAGSTRCWRTCGSTTAR